MSSGSDSEPDSESTASGTGTDSANGRGDNFKLNVTVDEPCQWRRDASLLAVTVSGDASATVCRPSQPRHPGKCGHHFNRLGRALPVTVRVMVPLGSLSRRPAAPRGRQSVAICRGLPLQVRHVSRCHTISPAQNRVTIGQKPDVRRAGRSLEMNTPKTPRAPSTTATQSLRGELASDLQAPFEGH